MAPFKFIWEHEAAHYTFAGAVQATHVSDESPAVKLFCAVVPMAGHRQAKVICEPGLSIYFGSLFYLQPSDIFF